MVTGHPFKGVNGLSIGQLAHPDLKRFQMNTPFLFTPPNPAAVAGATATAASIPTFGSFFSSYFGGSTYRLSDGRCGKMLENMKRCYESAASREDDPQTSCAFYIDGFRRLSCSQ